MSDQSNSGYISEQGDPQLLGARVKDGGINFAFAVADEAEAFLVLIDHGSGRSKKVKIPLPVRERTGDVSAVFVRCSNDIGYYYEVAGEKVLDPYATMIDGGICRVADREWDAGEDTAPGIDISDLMIYKLHVRGFTRRRKRNSAKGTFSGLAEMIPYIRELGFNAVELMPIYEFDETLRVQPFAAVRSTVVSLAAVKAEADNAASRESAAESPAIPAEADGEAAAETAVEPPKPVQAEPLRNYWGYAGKNWYFAPKASYAASDNPVRELRELIRAMHKGGIEVIMEMYFPEGTDPFMAMLAIRFWRSAYHIDGFRFAGPGTPFDSIVRSPLLKGAKLIFDEVDPYRIYGGLTPKRRNILTENDSFMHTARSFLKSDEGRAGEFSWLIRRNPATHGVINYAANVNGFTLFDAVSYNDKHNEANGENNADGTFLNYSWNCGAEGPTRKRSVRLLRARQMRNILIYTFLSQGVPLLYAGDEMCNTQLGNNNAYASDDIIGWVDWNTGRDAESLRSFVMKLAAFRKAHPIFHMEKELRGTDYRSLGCPDVSLHDEKAWVCPIENSTRTLAVMYNGMYTSKEAGEADDFFYVAYNAHWSAHTFALPVIPGFGAWYPAIDTHLPAGMEFAGDDAPMCEDQKYIMVYPRTVVVLRGKVPKKEEIQGRGRKKRARNNKMTEEA
ncbi:MAG: Type II secretory pathway, pullulanase PulA and related glycosidase [Lachnospiraceae bacterium]|nr:Type II secretory pathway, pullulanase PulA and related glycosidase [Lachnospiraceae bacterium]